MTLPEIMMASAILGVVLAGFLAMHIFALKSDQTVRLRLQALNDARRVLGQVATDIRSAGRIRVGNVQGTNGVFTEVTFGQPQRGNAIEIYPSKQDTNTYVRYFCDSKDDLLKRRLKGATEVILARSVTNDLVFASENEQGMVLSNNFNNRVISVTLQFFQDPNGNAAAGKGFLYDYYQIRTKATRRALE